MTTPDQNTPPPEPPAETVPKIEFDRVTSQLTEISNKFKALEDKARSSDLNALKGAQEWEKVAKLKEEEAQAANEKLSLFQTAYLKDKRTAALKEEALKNGILTSSIDDLDKFDFPEVIVEATSQGRTNILGVDRAIQRLKRERSHWFAGKVAPNLNTNSQTIVNSNDKPITPQDINAAELEARKTGNHNPYHDLVKRYTAQRKQQQIQ